jgi:hypothetical protein
MCGPLQAEPKKRKERAEATQERKKRRVVAEAEEPEEIDPSKEQKSQTDQRVVALQALLTSQTQPVSLFDFAVGVRTSEGCCALCFIAFCFSSSFIELDASVFCCFMFPQFNPKSFTQTVENIFDISFLAKEGRAGVRFGSEGTLFGPTHTPKKQDQVPNKQSIFKLDFNMYEEISLKNL